MYRKKNFFEELFLTLVSCFLNTSTLKSYYSSTYYLHKITYKTLREKLANTNGYENIYLKGTPERSNLNYEHAQSI